MAKATAVKPISANAPAEAPSDLLRLEYVYVKDMVFLAGNAKLHAEDRIMASIKDNGFRDPAAWDTAVGALVEGNGRLAVLSQMIQDCEPAPRGIMVDDAGDWMMPVLFGCDAKSEAMAQRYAIDHNMTVAFGGGLGVGEVAQMYDPKALAEILGRLEVDEMPASMVSDKELTELLALLKVDDQVEPELTLGSPDSFTTPAPAAPGVGAGVAGAGVEAPPPPPPSTVRMMQLFLNVETHPKMMQMMEVLMPKYNSSNPTDCVFAIVAEAFERVENDSDDGI